MNINTPPEGYDLQEYLFSKYGSAAVARFSSLDNPLDKAGERVGITFNKSRRVINTLDGHRLMEWCNNNFPEKADSLMESLFHAYFEQAKDLSKVDELLSCAKAVGLDETAAREILEGTAFRDEVLLADGEVKSKLRVSGVPFFIIEPLGGGRPTAFSGAQVMTVIKLLSSLCHVLMFILLSDYVMQPADVIAEVLEEAGSV